MSAPTFEAGTEASADEAQAALAAEAARRAEKAAETGLTQEEREQLAEHDGTAATPPAKPRKRTPGAQGNLAGGWEDLIGGEPDTEIKVSLKKPAAVVFENQPEKLLKQSVHRILLTVKVTEFVSSDTLDPDTHDVAESKGRRTLRVTSGVFLEPDEYIASAGDDVDVAAQAAADAAENG